jgi:(p)ppGpp synthase/HD superfamily hydrolase
LQDEFNVTDLDVLVAGILHDILEDTSVTYEEIGEKFSEKVADLVQEVSHPKNYTREQKEEYYEKIKTISYGAKLIKMADFTSHLRDFIKIYKRGEQHLYPKFVNNDKYIVSIREFLDSCEESIGKSVVYDLTNELESLL